MHNTSALVCHPHDAVSVIIRIQWPWHTLQYMYTIDMVAFVEYQFYDADVRSFSYGRAQEALSL